MPSTELRNNTLTAARQVVVKLGTQLLTAAGGGLDEGYIADIAKQVAALQKKGYTVTLVSSGSIGAGCAELGRARPPTDVADAQAIAAIGQRRLMTAWHDAFAPYGLGVGQVLLTRSDFDDRGRFLNIRNCVAHLHTLKCVPVLNENDTVAVDEIRFGDNDLLAALMCNALRADALLLLTVVDGLLDRDGEIVEKVDSVIDHLSMARQGKSKWGSGGMQSKLEAARLVMEAGEVAVIASGREPDVLSRVLGGEKLGTVFTPAAKKLDARSRWIGLTARPAGTVTIDDGAAAALTQRNKSLLATGITALTGRFERGDVLLIRDPNGREVGRGLSNYTSEELRLILGKKSNQFAKILGKPGYAEVIHRDNLVVLT